MFATYQTIVKTIDAFRVDDVAAAASLVGGVVLTGIGGRSVGLPGDAGQAFAGDWICRSVDGRLWAMQDSGFALKYVAEESEPEDPEKPTPTRSRK